MRRMFARLFKGVVFYSQGIQNVPHSKNKPNPEAYKANNEL